MLLSFFAVVSYLLLETSIVWLIIPMVVLILSFILGSIFIKANFFLPSICNAEGKDKQIALSFDDGPHPTITNELLDLFQKENVKASFFCIGKEVAKHPEIVKRAYNEGHVIANHSWSHSNFIDFNSNKKWENELNQTNEIIFETIGKRPVFFRPPFGVTTPHLARALESTKMNSIAWSLRTMDTVAKSEEALLAKVKSKVKAGDIILFHDTQEISPKVVSKLISYLKENDFELVGIDQLIEKKAYG